MTAAVAVSVNHWQAPREPGEQLAAEQAMFDSLPASQHLCIWQPLRALIVTRAEAVQPAFAAAAERARHRGLPVHVRSSGGGAVCLGPGMLVVSHVYSSSHNDIDASYRSFARAIMAAVQRLGVSLSDEHVPQAYCDGKFDLAVGGLKVGGIAQRRRVLRGATRVWIHAALAVGRESRRHPQAVAEFYADLHSTRVADPQRTTCLAECLATPGSSRDLMERCADAIVGATLGQPSPPMFAG